MPFEVISNGHGGHIGQFFSRDHTQTVRFDPVGEPENWEIGSPYIPETILPDAAITELIIEIEWR